MLDIYRYLFANAFTSPGGTITTSSFQERDQYIKDNIEFFRRIIMHNLDTAGICNDGEPLAKTKYYKHLFGERMDADEPMEILSFDTKTMVTFDKPTMADHPITIRHLQKYEGTYNNFMRKYPLNEILIRGIMDPVHPDISTVAKDGQILYYDRRLVDEQEMSLIYKLQDWIYKYIHRWHNRNFSFSDSLYPTCHLAVMFAHLPSRLIAIRNEAVHTYEAHSFHIRQHLASNGLLDRVMDDLSLSQQMFLYRNLTFLKKYSGSREAFDAMIFGLVRSTNIIIGGYHTELEHKDGKLVPIFDRRLYSETGIENKRLSLIEYRAIEALINPNNDIITNREYLKRILTVDYSDVLTKMIEIGDNPAHTSKSYTLLECYIYHWAWLSNTHKYPGVIQFSMTAKGQYVTTTPVVAFHLWLLMVRKLAGHTDVLMPCNIDIPIIQTMDNIAGIQYPSVIEALSTLGDDTYEGASVLEDNLVDLSKIDDRSTFKDTIFKVHKGYIQTRHFTDGQECLELRSVMTAFMAETYGHATNLPLRYGGTDVDTWLTDHNIHLPDDPGQLTVAIDRIMLASTGFIDYNANFGTANAVRTIMQQLCSYSVQFNVIAPVPNLVCDAHFDRISKIELAEVTTPVTYRVVFRACAAGGISANNKNRQLLGQCPSDDYDHNAMGLLVDVHMVEFFGGDFRSAIGNINSRRDDLWADRIDVGSVDNRDPDAPFTFDNNVLTIPAPVNYVMGEETLNTGYVGRKYASESPSISGVRVMVAPHGHWNDDSGTILPAGIRSVSLESQQEGSEHWKVEGAWCGAQKWQAADGSPSVVEFTIGIDEVDAVDCDSSDPECIHGHAAYRIEITGV